MPRSSRHKSSKSSSREVRDYSDSEKELSLKEKKGKDNVIRHSKEPSSGEKRKLDSRSVDIAKELTVSTVKKVYTDEYAASSSSVKKRKEKVDNDRWTGGSNNKHELLKSDMKGFEEKRSSSDTKRSSRRDGTVVSESNEEEGKSRTNVELKHHWMERKEKSGKEESKVSKSEILTDGITMTKNIGREGNTKLDSFADERGEKLAVGNTGSSATCYLKS